MIEAAESGVASKKQVALLTGRMRFNEGKPQVYGTVLDWNESGELVCELEDPDGLDARRASVGLSPFQEALQEQRREVAAEGGKPPSDFARHRAAASEWVKKAGWL